MRRLRQKSQLFSGLSKSIWKCMLSKVIQLLHRVGEMPTNFFSSSRNQNVLLMQNWVYKKYVSQFKRRESWMLIFFFLFHSLGKIIKFKMLFTFLLHFALCTNERGIRIFFCFHFRMQSVSTCFGERKTGSDWKEEEESGIQCRLWQMKPSVLQIAEFNILYDDWKINVSKFIYKSEGLY